MTTPTPAPEATMSPEEVTAQEAWDRTRPAGTLFWNELVGHAQARIAAMFACATRSRECNRDTIAGLVFIRGRVSFTTTWEELKGAAERSPSHALQRQVDECYATADAILASLKGQS